MAESVAERRPRHVVVVDNSALARAIGERIRRHRELASLTQAQLAGDRYTAAYISALERGLAKPSLASMAYLAPRLGVGLRDLVDDPPEPEAAIHRELDAIAEKLVHTRELLEMMIAFRVLEHGHAPSLGEAMRMARDLDRVRELFPVAAHG